MDRRDVADLRGTAAWSVEGLDELEDLQRRRSLRRGAMLDEWFAVTICGDIMLSVVLASTLHRPTHCVDSFYQLMQNVPTPSSRFDKSRTVVNTAKNEIRRIQKIETVSGDLIGYLYDTGDGTRFASGRPASFTREGRRLRQLYASWYRPLPPLYTHQPLYAILTPVPTDYKFQSRYHLMPCVLL